MDCRSSYTRSWAWVKELGLSYEIGRLWMVSNVNR
ncbi:hypothetical protein SAMN04490191_5117 [Pseudomonas lini]|uniref:Uncharacterized protein n=1 Tax=Pseudomonas lini TaxID=163011 RepID=A0A1H2B9S0_9PSED|nr:hypothetical protein SAMN04490191_5117 [Pseudomonas lini]